VGGKSVALVLGKALVLWKIFTNDEEGFIPLEILDERVNKVTYKDVGICWC